MYIKYFVFAIIISLAPQLMFAQLQLQQAFPNLTFTRPVDFQHSNDATNRLFVVEQAGIIKVFQNDNQTNTATTFLDIRNLVDDTGNEEGLLGLAFHPNYASNGYFYVNYTANQPNRTIISRFSVSSSNPNLAEADSELVLLEFSQPHPNHNGGQLAFGPSDGYLYIATGDGGSYGDPDCNSLNLSTLLGKLLRIDVDQTSGNQAYSIPPDNPYASNMMGYREEIFAYGLRNPWRFSFDAVTGWIWTADVGQGAWEEIDIVISGGNYGWSMFEGFHCYTSPWPCTPPCDSTGIIMPVWEYSHSEGLSVTGGYVYRGTLIPELLGKYVYADFMSGRIWALSHDSTSQTTNALLINSNLNISSFGTDQDNELYMCAFDNKIYRFQSTVTPIHGNQLRVPGGFRMEQNFPNPFNNETVIPVYLPRDAFVQIYIYDIQGKRVRTLVNQQLSSGPHKIRWNSSDGVQNELSSGLYVYQFVVDSQVVEKKQMLLLK